MRTFNYIAAIGALCAFGCTKAAQVAAPAKEPVITQRTSAADTGGLGWLTARNERGEAGLVTLSRVNVEAEQVGSYAAVSVEHHFHNAAKTVQEGTFRFPLPDGALLTGLRMWIDGKPMEGELVEREKAKKIYEQIVDSMQDPALLEWEHGTTFKLRVFPIEPEREKIVTIRYLTPLEQRGSDYWFVQGTRQGGESAKLPELSIHWQGKPVFSERAVQVGRSIEIAATAPAEAQREERSDGVYTALRIRPDWSRVPKPNSKPVQHWIFAVDTSRSSLEERKLTLEALKAALAQLAPTERFITLTSDLETHVDPRGFDLASAASIASATKFVEATPADGATNLSALAETVAKLSASAPNAAVVYFGDCEPTWGVVEPNALRTSVSQALGQTSFNPVVIGASVDTELAQSLAQATSGRVLRARQPAQVASFVQGLRTQRPRLNAIEVSALGGAEVYPKGKLSLEQGEDLELLVKTAKGQDVQSAVSVQAVLGSRKLDLLPRAKPVPTRFVAPRFGSRFISALERDNQPKERVVAESLNYGVMSKYTSFLVLESEEAYAHYAIQRRAAQQADAPRVTGANLDSLNADDASISLNRIQPGDPEIYVDAPRDSQSVTVELPNGERKRALFDPEANRGRGAWMVRFLVDRRTPEGNYEASAFIVHRDGRSELRRVAYTVDRSAPALDVAVRRTPNRANRYEVTVTQRGPRADRDLRRVEIRTPDGRVVQLNAVRWAEFRGSFRAPPANTDAKLRVVGFDQALNQSITEITLP